MTSGLQIFQRASLRRIILSLPFAVYLTACSAPPADVSWLYAGVEVASVIPGSAAAAKSIVPGERIVQVGTDRTITSVQELLGVLEAIHNDGRDALLLVYRGDKPRFVALDLKQDKFGGLRFQIP
jgi:S1-C subfamily serine protease